MGHHPWLKGRGGLSCRLFLPWAVSGKQSRTLEPVAVSGSVRAALSDPIASFLARLAIPANDKAEKIADLFKRAPIQLGLHALLKLAEDAIKLLLAKLIGRQTAF